jgi:hypothetical protein
MAINERMRMRYTGRGKGPPFLKLLHHVVASPQFGALKGSALKMLIDLACQFNGKNNGDLSPALLRKSGRWKSEAKINFAIAYLLQHYWLVKTKQGGMGIGCNLYAVTWWPIDACDGKHDQPAEQSASNLWGKKLPHLKQVVSTPETGVRDQQNCSNIDHLTPETGARKAIFRAA